MITSGFSCLNFSVRKTYQCYAYTEAEALSLQPCYSVCILHNNFFKNSTVSGGGLDATLQYRELDRGWPAN